VEGGRKKNGDHRWNRRVGGLISGPCPVEIRSSGSRKKPVLPGMGGTRETGKVKGGKQGGEEN